VDPDEAVLEEAAVEKARHDLLDPAVEAPVRAAEPLVNFPRKPAGARNPLDVVTTCDYHVVMRTVRIGELKARLSEYLRGVRRGRSLTVLDRNTPIAVISPYRGNGGGALVVRSPVPETPSLPRVPLPRPLAVGIDAVELLLEDRRRVR
jgi:prevent-host-death family protein